MRIAGRAYPDELLTHRAAIAALRQRGMIASNGWRARPTITDSANLATRTNRLRAIVSMPATPRGRDAELLALAAVAGALPITTRREHLSARARLASIARLNPAPPALQALADHLGADTPAEFAERLLASKWDISPFSQNTIMSYGGLGAGDGGGHHGGHG